MKDFQPVAALKAAELLGKHLRLFGENATHQGDVRFEIGPVPVQIITNVDIASSDPALSHGKGSPIFDMKERLLDAPQSEHAPQPEPPQLEHSDLQMVTQVDGEKPEPAREPEPPGREPIPIVRRNRRRMGMRKWWLN